jgi:hypothetical protein
VVGSPDDNRMGPNAWKSVVLAVRWPLAALVLALAVYALLRPWGPPGADARLPGPVAGSKVVEEVEARADADADADGPDADTDAPPGTDGTTPFDAAPLAGAIAAPILASFAPDSDELQRPTRDARTRTRDPIATRNGRDARSPRVRTTAGGDRERAEPKNTRKDTKTAPSGARKTVKAERKDARQDAKAHRPPSAQPSARPTARPSAPAVKHPAKKASPRPAVKHAAKKHGNAVAHAAKKHGHGKAHGKGKKNGSKRR